MKSRKAAAVILCAAILTGCAETPDQPIVREKGSSQKTYQETADGGEASGNEEAWSGSEQGDARDGADTGGTAGGENVLAARLEAPAAYQSQTEGEGNISVNCDAQVEIPDTDHVAVIQVSQLSLEEELIDRMTKGFFGDCPVYEAGKYFQTTREEALEYLRHCGDIRPRATKIPTDTSPGREEGEEDPESFYSLSDEIAVWEEIWQNAPEEKEKVEVTPDSAIYRRERIRRC